MKGRQEDRHSCHATSFVLGLAVAAKNAAVASVCYERMLALVTPVKGQKPN